MRLSKPFLCPSIWGELASRSSPGFGSLLSTSEARGSVCLGFKPRASCPDAGPN